MPTAGPDGYTRLQRLLLSTDGTVTRLLEAYAGEPVEVVKLRQGHDTASAGDGLLCLQDGDEVLRREVLLRGRHSGRKLLYAQAVVAAGRVDPGLLEALERTSEPIGALLAAGRTETFREVLLVGRGPAGSCGAHLGIDARAELISRTYRIFARRQPAILITERFPADSFLHLPD